MIGTNIFLVNTENCRVKFYAYVIRISEVRGNHFIMTTLEKLCGCISLSLYLK